MTVLEHAYIIERGPDGLVVRGVSKAEAETLAAKGITIYPTLDEAQVVWERHC